MLSVCSALQLRKVERDKKTMDQEIVELTNKLLDAKNTVNRLEELNVGHTPLSLCLCVSRPRSATDRTLTLSLALSLCLFVSRPGALQTGL